MEDWKTQLTQRDAYRLLSKEDYETLESLEETRRRGFTLNPRAETIYFRLLDKLEDEKGKEHAEMLAAEYREKLKEDELKLVELSSGVAVSTYQEALEFFIGAYLGFEKILRAHNPANWIPGCLPKIKAAAEGGVEGIFDYFMDEIENPDAFSYNKTIWPILIPVVDYIKKGIDCLEFEFTAYTVSVIEVHHVEHKKNFGAWVFTFPGSEKPISNYTDIFDPGTLNMAPPKITVPLRLLLGLASGELQPGGCEVIKHKDGVLTYRVEGFEAEVTLPHDFIAFLMDLGEEPLKALQELGLLDELTLRILESKKGEELMELPVMREKDRTYLRTINEIEGFLTYGGWGEALGLTKQGADSLLKRMEGEGMVSIIKHESGEGIRASLTTLGLAVLRHIPEFDG